jgi:transcriptional regulator with XRE-family HTH domain
MDLMPKKSAEDFEATRAVVAHLRREMESRGLTDAEAARRLGISKSNLGRILAGERTISAGFVLKVARTFLIQPTTLLTEPTRPQPATGLRH